MTVYIWLNLIFENMLYKLQYLQYCYTVYNTVYNTIL